MQKTVKLVTPFDVDGEAINEVTVRGPKAGDYLAVEKKGKGEQARSIEMIRLLCGLTQQAVQELDDVDVERIEKAVAAIKAEKQKRAEELDKGN